LEKSAPARQIPKQLGVELHSQKTRIVHVRYGFESLATKSSAGTERFICLPARFVVRPDRMRYTRFPRRSRSVVSWTRYGNESSGRAFEKPRSRLRNLTRYCGVGANITNAPTFESFSNLSRAGFGDESGRIGTSIGATLAGNGCLRPRCIVSTCLFGWSI